MWSAIKSDLFEFVATVQEEAHETIAKVVDIEHRSAEEEKKISEDEKILSDFRNNLSTYSEDVDPEQLPEFEKFLKSFSLSSKAEEIEYILEEEAGVTKHYDALVPAQLTPTMFWARYFFKVNILIISSLDSVLESAYDDEEELTWGEDDDCDKRDDDDDDDVETTSLKVPSQQSIKLAPTFESLPGKSTDGKSHNEISVADDVALVAASKITKLQEINDSLTTRAAMLESEVEKLQNQLIKERTVSAKLRNGLAQSEEREKSLFDEVLDLKQKLQSCEQTLHEKIISSPPSEVSHSAPPSNGSSLVDLGTSHHPENDLVSVVSKSVPQGEMVPSVSDISLASLQSVSSNSSTSDNKSTCLVQTVETSNKEASESAQVPTNVLMTKDDVSEGMNQEIVNDVDADEEEWDNEAWE